MSLLVPGVKKLRCRLVGLLLVLLCWPNQMSRCSAQQSTASSTESHRWAVIVVGNPGDAEHAATFRKSADRIQNWLIETQRIPAEQVLRLPTADTDLSLAAPTADSIQTLLTDLSSNLQVEDALWVLTLGHGNYDGRQAWFHAAGRDPSADDFGRWMADVRCREQVVWLMHSSSGWFVRPLSRPGRIVIAATAADDESNETEFPHAFAMVADQPIDTLDSDQDHSVSVAEYYTAVVKEVARMFQRGNRLPTEHAQLDDNGDGLGTEDIGPGLSNDQASDTPTARASKLDGFLARSTWIPYHGSLANTDQEFPEE